MSGKICVYVFDLVSDLWTHGALKRETELSNGLSAACLFCFQNMQTHICWDAEFSFPTLISGLGRRLLVEMCNSLCTKRWHMPSTWCRSTRRTLSFLLICHLLPNAVASSSSKRNRRSKLHTLNTVRRTLQNFAFFEWRFPINSLILQLLCGWVRILPAIKFWSQISQLWPSSKIPTRREFYGWSLDNDVLWAYLGEED